MKNNNRRLVSKIWAGVMNRVSWVQNGSPCCNAFCTHDYYSLLANTWTNTACSLVLSVEAMAFIGLEAGQDLPEGASLPTLPHMGIFSYKKQCLF